MARQVRFSYLYHIAQERLYHNADITYHQSKRKGLQEHNLHK
jgi:hypothetical protein